MFKRFKRPLKGLAFGTYPSCDHLNLALCYLLENPETNRFAIEEICYAIRKADGYFYDHTRDMLLRNGFAGFVEGAEEDAAD